MGAEHALSQRLEELRADFERGQQQLAQLDQRRAELRDTLLRISGAIQVLEEMIEQGDESPKASSVERASEDRS